MWNQLSVQVLYKAFLPRFMGGCFWTFINGDSRLLYGTFSGVVKSDLWQSNNVLCVFVCADRVGYDHQQQNQFAECEYGQLSVFVYSAVTGVTLSAIFLMYTQESIATTFGITAGTFGATALLDMSLKGFKQNGQYLVYAFDWSDHRFGRQYVFEK